MKHSILFLAACLPLLVNAQKEKFPFIITPKFKKDTLSIKQYGAVPDGYTLNTKSITTTIETLHRKGGGVVRILGWIVASIVLKSQ